MILKVSFVRKVDIEKRNHHQPKDSAKKKTGTMFRDILTQKISRITKNSK